MSDRGSRWALLLSLLAAGAATGCEGVIDGPGGGEVTDGAGPAIVDGGSVNGSDGGGAATADGGSGTPDASGPGTPDASGPGTPDASGPGTPDASGPGTPDSGSTGGIDCRDPGTWPADWVAFEDQVLVLINQRRAAGATCGTTVKPAVGALSMDSALREAARCHSLDMAVNGYFDHTSQDGSSPWDRIAEAGYTGSPTGENIAAGYGTPADAVTGWMGSEGHCNNIMSGGSNQTGIGYAFQDGSPFGSYWTETFGHD